MLINILKSKIHRARITECDIHYEGSLGIDATLMELAGIKEYEKILVANITNGQRFETYCIKEKKGSGSIKLNGAAARIGAVGDKIIILAFGLIEKDEARSFAPKIIVLDDQNRPEEKT